MRGERNRATRETKSNVNSSRSHTVFQLCVDVLDSSKAEDGKLEFRRARLNLCDLAGSEKVGIDENLSSEHLQELKTINLSLSSLGKVIQCLALGKKRDHVPYRDSKLTRLLQDSLASSNCRTTVIAMISCASSCLQESISTLKFADRAKSIIAVTNTKIQQKRGAQVNQKYLGNRQIIDDPQSVKMITSL